MTKSGKPALTKAAKTGRPRVPAATEERVFAAFCVTLSYAATARATGVPESTVGDIVKRLAKDDVAELRRALRSDMAAEAFSQARGLFDLVKPGNLGTAHSSVGAEAARAALELVKAGELLSRGDKALDVPATIINVHTGVAAPLEIGHERGEHVGPVAGCAMCAS